MHCSNTIMVHDAHPLWLSICSWITSIAVSIGASGSGPIRAKRGPHSNRRANLSMYVISTLAAAVATCICTQPEDVVLYKLSHKQNETLQLLGIEISCIVSADDASLICKRRQATHNSA